MRSALRCRHVACRQEDAVHIKLRLHKPQLHSTELALQPSLALHCFSHSACQRDAAVPHQTWAASHESSARFTCSPLTQPEQKLLCLTRHKLLESQLHGSRRGWGAACPTSLPNVLADRKLLFLIRHGQAWSNYLEEVLGPDLW